MFAEDLKEWRNVELEYARELIDQKLKNLELAPDKKFTDRDLKITTNDDREISYEIKHDIVSETSWNIWFEFFCNKSPSGVYASKADVIVYKLWDKFYPMNRAKLLIWLNWVKKSVKKWWDNNASYMYVVSKEDFFKDYKRLS